MDVPLHKYWGEMSPCPIGIDAPGGGYVLQTFQKWGRICIVTPVQRAHVAWGGIYVLLIVGWAGPGG